MSDANEGQGTNEEQSTTDYLLESAKNAERLNESLEQLGDVSPAALAADSLVEKIVEDLHGGELTDEERRVLIGKLFNLDPEAYGTLRDSDCISIAEDATVDKAVPEPKQFTHVMIDLETLDKTPNSAIISIGAVEFDPMTDETGREFYERIDWASATAVGSVSFETIKWWMVQPEAARQEIVKEGKPIQLVLTEFTGWLGDKKTVWGNGSTFDITILQMAYNNALGAETPWAFWNVHDVRTIVALCDGYVEKGKCEDAHNALSDAKHQAAYVSEMWMAARGGLV